VGFENELAPLNELRGHFVPDIEALSAVYITFSELVLTQWLGWLAEHGGHDPNWVPYSHLKISWQLASVASWVGLPALLACLDRMLHGSNAGEQFVALTFTELVVRIGRAGGQLQMYGGGSIASDFLEVERPLASREIPLNAPLSVAEMEGLISAKQMTSSDGVAAAEEVGAETSRGASWQTPTAPKLDLVDCSVFGPPTAPPGETVLIQIFLHLPSQAEQARFLATIMDPSAALKGVQTLEARIERGARVDITLATSGLIVEEPVQSVFWTGAPAFRQLVVTIPEHTNGQDFFPIVRISVDGRLIGRIIFRLSSNVSTSSPKSGPLGDHARLYKYAFVSYATEDRKEVLKRVQMLPIMKTEFFQDVPSLGPGDRWEKKLYQNIARCDLFLLFWSQAAAQSQWVIKEAEYALKHQQSDPKSEPDLVPVILEQNVPRPPSLSALHFNDRIQYLISLMP
jgi:TIR domain